MTYQGGCHCGRIAFSVEGEIGKVIDCNCSYCQSQGNLLWFVPREQLRLRTPESDMSTYKFNKHRIAHHFCPACGLGPFSDGEQNGERMAAVNVRCLKDVEPGELQIKPFDGRSL